MTDHSTGRTGAWHTIAYRPPQTLDKGFVAADGTTGEPLIVHLPCRAGRFAPEGWCVEPGANIIGIVDATGLELRDGKVGGKMQVVPWEACISRGYELDGTAGESGIAGMNLHPTVATRPSTVKAHPREAVTRQ